MDYVAVEAFILEAYAMSDQVWQSLAIHHQVRQYLYVWYACIVHHKQVLYFVLLDTTLAASKLLSKFREI